jgi:hypothetical protein
MPSQVDSYALRGQQISWLAARSITHRFVRLFNPSLPEKPADHNKSVLVFMILLGFRTESRIKSHRLFPYGSSSDHYGRPDPQNCGLEPTQSRIRYVVILHEWISA